MLSVSCRRASRVSAEAKHPRINAPNCGISRTLEEVVIYSVIRGNEVAGGGGRNDFTIHVMMQYMYACICMHVYVYVYVHVYVYVCVSGNKVRV